MAEVGIDPLVCNVGDSYDNALAESTIRLFKTEVINFFGSWKSVSQVEWETLKWANCYNSERLHSAIGYVMQLCCAKPRRLAGSMIGVSGTAYAALPMAGMVSGRWMGLRINSGCLRRCRRSRVLRLHAADGFLSGASRSRRPPFLAIPQRSCARSRFPIGSPPRSGNGISCPCARRPATRRKLSLHRRSRARLSRHEGRFQSDPRKNKVRRLVAHGIKMMRGGYRLLLHYPVKSGKR